MATLPNAESAELPVDKLRDYALNPAHPRGQHKARVFRSALGIGRDDWEYLRDQILSRVTSASVASITSTVYGFLYEVPILVEGLNGETHEVITAWHVAEEEEIPQLVSAYVNIP